jgi:hypothetical protein
MSIFVQYQCGTRMSFLDASSRKKGGLVYVPTIDMIKTLYPLLHGEETEGVFSPLQIDY